MRALFGALLRHATLREGIGRWNCNECKSNWRQAGMLRDALGGLTMAWIRPHPRIAGLGDPRKRGPSQVSEVVPKIKRLRAKSRS